jgi:hypothetical protein
MVDQLRATYMIDEAARILGVGELAQVAIRIGRRVLIPREALHRLLASEPPAPLDEPKELERVSA